MKSVRFWSVWGHLEKHKLFPFFSPTNKYCFVIKTYPIEFRKWPLFIETKMSSSKRHLIHLAQVQIWLTQVSTVRRIMIWAQTQLQGSLIRVSANYGKLRPHQGLAITTFKNRILMVIKSSTVTLAQILKLLTHCSQGLEDVIPLLNPKAKECQFNKIPHQAQANSNSQITKPNYGNQP